MIDLKKVIEPGSLRWLGQTYKGLPPHKTVIAGKEISNIALAIGLPCYRFKRFNVKNIFVIHDSKKIAYVFVNPKYKYYRKAFKEVIGNIPHKFDVDHVLSKSLANHLGYNYVLLGIVPFKVNIRHGRFEKIKINIDDVPKICYPDDRIFDKILSRNPTARRSKDELLKGYTPQAILKSGLTLKQAGIWNSTFAFDSIDIQTLISKTIPI